MNNNTTSPDVPLCVDLDGTLIENDTFFVILKALLCRNPGYLFLMGFWILRGRAYLKQQVAKRTTLDPATLPYSSAFLDFLREEHQRGRKLVLVTATDQHIADQVAVYLGIFSEVFASNGRRNLKSYNKRDVLNQHFGEKHYDYAGNERADLVVWKATRYAIVVNATPHLLARAHDIATVSRVFP
jgi:phosphoserine phosphatase